MLDDQIAVGLEARYNLENFNVQLSGKKDWKSPYLFNLISCLEMNLFILLMINEKIS